MTDCPLQQRPDGKWFCSVCDPGQQRLLPVPARRNCDKRLAAVTKRPPPGKVLITQARASKAARPGDSVEDDEIRRRVAVCEQCVEFVSQVPACQERLDVVSPCEATKRLVSRIVRGRCGRW